MSLGIGGAETHVVSLARHLLARGWDVRVASGGGALVERLVESGIEHVYAPLHSRSPASILGAYRTVRRIVDSGKIGLVHAHARIPAWIAGGICVRRGIPMVTTYHGTFVSGPFWNFFTRPGDRTIAVSDDIRDYVVREFGFRRERVTVIPNGIDLAIFRAPNPYDREDGRRHLRVPPWASHVILYESRLDWDLVKVAETAIDAALILRMKYPDIHLLVAGDGPGIGRVSERARSANRSSGRETVRCAGYLTETFYAYAASDLVVGMSRVALEAMASERPVVVAGPDGIFGAVRPETEDALEDRNYTSRNAPHPLSPERLAGEIDAVLAESDDLPALGRFGRKIVAERHSMDEVTLRTEEVYAQALEGTRS